MLKVVANLLFLISFTASGAQTISFAVGHDHDKMVKHYAFYAASWEIVNHELELLGYEVTANAYPWARAKEMVKNGQHHGLFLAANFQGRDKWALFSQALGKDQFGLFKHKEGGSTGPIASVRLISDYSLVSFISPKTQLQLATAQEGLNLLANKKVKGFVMSRSYGEYLLATELNDIAEKIAFDTNRYDLYSAHIAVSKTHKEAEGTVALIDKALANSIASGRYQDIMTKHQVRGVQLMAKDSGNK
ncbi:MAG: amino acid ABC transporter substrate-binding protein [Colwelliaceae bacterium]|nr:amino acid ABC transporter substrate-binding protein [Colwelliaceae bacterium]